MSEQTQNKGQTVDLIISKDINIYKVVVTDSAFSDHFSAFFDGAICAHTNKTEFQIQLKIVVDHF